MNAKRDGICSRQSISPTPSPPPMPSTPRCKQAEQILAGGGHYLMAVKRNQPSLYEAIELAFTALPPINQEEAAFWQHQTYTTYDKQHGRLEKRTLESTTALK